jgi:hypothetical protein
MMQRPKLRIALGVLVCMRMLLCGGCIAQEVGQADKKGDAAGRVDLPLGARLLIIDAEDLGMAHAVNKATFEAHRPAITKQQPNPR